MACRGRADGSDRLRRGRQCNGLHNHLLDFCLIPSKFHAGKGIVGFVDVPQRRALVVRQHPLKVPTGYVAPISNSYGPRRVGVLGPSLRTRDGVASVHLAVLFF